MSLINIMSSRSVFIGRGGAGQHGTPSGRGATAGVVVCDDAVCGPRHLQLGVPGPHQAQHHHQWPKALCREAHHSHLTPVTRLHGTQVSQDDGVRLFVLSFIS